MSPLVSCIVSVRNAERYLAETIDSMLAQTYRPIEILVVDGRSTDRTASVVQRYGPPVIYIWNEGDTGASNGRNVGLAAARGEFVAFLDGDDLWHPEKLAIQMARFEARPELEVSLTHLENFWSADVPLEARWFSDDKRPLVMPGYSPVTLLARRDVFDRHGPWDAHQGHAANSEWFVRIQEGGAIVELLPQTLVRRRLHASNLSRSQARESYDDHFRMVRAALERRRTESRPPSIDPQRPPR